MNTKELVTVKSKTINNEAVPVVFNTSEVMQGEEKDVREISRTVTFTNYEAQVPFYLAKLLVKMNPNEYQIIDPEAKPGEFKCEHCGTEARSKAGLTAHVRYNHPDKWSDKKLNNSTTTL